MIWDKRLAATAAALTVTIAAAIIVSLQPGREQDALPIQEPVSGIEAMQPQYPQQEIEDDYLYMIKEHQGRIAIFARGSEVPELIFDKQLKHLPEYDRIQLKEGIKIYTSEELNARIEDYIS
ncbi:MAG: hypothetical protein ACOX0K_03590 [Oscillospiraceae bacterium]|jgi:hypothetical protein